MIKELVTENRYPIVFIGSGISKRYLEEFPTWESLLKEYWEKIGEKQNFFAHLRSIRQSISSSNDTDENKTFNANTLVASEIQRKFDDLFYNEKIIVEGLTIDEAYKKSISPFKFEIANRFRNYTILEDKLDEIEDFKLFLSKAKVIVTTNYDTFIEDLLNEVGAKPTIYVGQNGFFDPTHDWSELYKIHGDIGLPDSIVITEEDYQKYDKNSILLSAKLLVNMIDSPIVFIGYSLTDRNVRKLLNDFSSQLPREDIRKTTNRIAIIQYKDGDMTVNEEMYRDQSLDLNYLLVSTDNYSFFYNQISKINEGLSPHDILRYQRAIKNIVINAGSHGALDTVLVSPKEMEELEKQIERGKNIVVALGDKKYLYVIPDLVSYMKDYLFEERDIMPNVAMEFIGNENVPTRTPFARYILENDIHKMGLSEDKIKKIEDKINTHGELETIKESVPQNYKKKYTAITDIFHTTYSMIRKVDLTTYNIDNIPFEDVEDYVLGEGFQLFREAHIEKKTALKSSLRRLFFAYDLLKHGDIKNPKST